MYVAELNSADYQDSSPNYSHGTNNVSNWRFRRKTVRVQTPNSWWIQELKERFNELTSLPDGWDGYNGQAVTFSNAQFAANLIESLCVENVPHPQLVPGADGTLQLEWHMNGFDVEIDVLGPYSVIATRFRNETGLDEEIEIEADFTELANWIKALGEDCSDLQQRG